MIDLLLHVLAWFAMLGSAIRALVYPLTHDIDMVPYEKQGKFKAAWCRACGEAIIISLLALRVLGKI